MNNAVLIKGNRYGITIVMDEKIPFEQLLLELEHKLEAAEQFFDCEKQLAISFEGRSLSNEELDEILTVIESCSKLNISYILDENSDLEATFYDIIQTAQDEEVKKTNADPPAASELSDDLYMNSNQSSGLFYRGTLYAGETFETKDSVIILGDVNAGATVISNGNIVVIGSLKGVAKAGCTGDKNAFVMALMMEPESIEIDGIVAKEHALKKAGRNKKESMIAIVIDKQISIDPISKSAIHDFRF